MLYDLNATTMLLGCFCHRPHLILADQYKIGENDFRCKGIEESQFYHIVYRVLYNIARQGAIQIDSVTFDMFLQNYKTQYEFCSKYNHMEFIDTIVEIVNPDNIDLYYTTFRKYALLREYKSAGFNIAGIYDELKDETEQRENVSKLTLNDIVNYFSSLQTEIKQKYIYSDCIQHHQLGDNLEYAFERYKTGGTVGLGFSNPFLNRLTNGYTGLTLISGDSGSGKSMVSVGNICKVGCEYLYNSTTKQWEKNPSFCGNALFINTELKFTEQLQPMFLAYVADIERSRIKCWDLTEDEIKRVKKAGEIISQHLFAVDMPDFTISLISETVDFYVARHNIKVVAFDYVQYNSLMGADVSKSSKISNREDMVLLELTKALKELSLKHNIPVLSGTQLSRKSREGKNPDATWLAGGISQEFKCDIVFVITQITKEDLCDLEPYESFWTEETKPTHCIHMTKGRDSKFPKGSRVYTRIDLGTGRDYPIFCTDKNLEMLDIKPMEISFE